MAKMGRPRANIDQKQFENLCRLQCTRDEICGWFSITDKTLNRWCKETYKKTFSAVYEEKRQGGKISLRRSQWRLSETNPTMAIWLGKQYLGQRDPDKEKADMNITHAIDNNLAEVIGRAVTMSPGLDDAEEEEG